MFHQDHGSLLRVLDVLPHRDHADQETSEKKKKKICSTVPSTTAKKLGSGCLAIHYKTDPSRQLQPKTKPLLCTIYITLWSYALFQSNNLLPIFPENTALHKLIGCKINSGI